MATSNEKRQAFKINSVFPAIVTKIKDDRVFFNITREIKTKSGTQTITETAAFFAKGHMFNPHLFFSKGRSVQVTVNKLCKPSQNFYGLSCIVTPVFLPSDVYIASHPVGSLVNGTIEAIHGSTMTVVLDKNVWVITKRCRHARTGEFVDCKIDKFRHQKISVRVMN